MKAKILGIIGGMGPLATAQLYEMITLHTKVTKEQEHLHILIDSAVEIPDRTDYILTKEHDPRPSIKEAAKRLKNAGADHLIMPCNTAHYFKSSILEIEDNGFIDMIEVTADHIDLHFKEASHIVLMATKGVYEGRVYTDVFKKHNLTLIHPNDSEKEVIMGLIYAIKLGKTDYLKEYNAILDGYIKKGITHFITGCTELSVAKERFDLHGIQIDPLMCLTEHVIALFGKEFTNY